jgi:GT2 family glycosyltransferase
MDVSAVIVTYNALPWIERSLASLEGTGAEAIVVDHGSSDGTLASAFPPRGSSSRRTAGSEEGRTPGCGPPRVATTCS